MTSADESASRSNGEITDLELKQRPRKPWLMLLSLTTFGFAAGTATFAHKNGLLQDMYQRVSKQLERSEQVAKEALSRADQNAKENDRLREENRHQEGVIEMQTKARKAAEQRTKQAEERERVQKKRAEEAEAKAEAERVRADAAEEEANREKMRAEALEDDNRRMQKSEEEASKRNLGEALDTLAALERTLPEHEALEGDERTVWLRHDCSKLHRLRYDLNRAGAERARERRDALEQRFEEACADAQP